MKRTLERMDGWMDEENRQGKLAEDDFLLRMKNLRAAAKRMLNRLDDGKRNLRRV